MDFGIMFWGDALSANRVTRDYYRGLVNVARFADEHDFSGVWLPERHFHPWGGQHPNPSVMAAGLATVTSRIKLRAGSVVLPLHNPIRVVEEWSVVDNLSGGRCELSIATGWKDDDFLLAPERYRTRHADVWETVRTVQNVWAGERLAGENGHGARIEVSTYPRPVQPTLPIWITSAGNPETIGRAGSGGFGLLTHLLGQDLSSLAKKLAIYQQKRSAAGFEGPGRVALMVHAFLGSDRARVKQTVRPALMEYLLNSADLTVPREKRAEWERTDARTKTQLMELAFERYFETGSLMGTPASCKPIVERLRTMGVTEVCCLVDFGLPLDLVLEGMEHLAELRKLCAV